MLVAVGLDRERATAADAEAHSPAWSTDELAAALSAHARFDGVDEVLVVAPGQRLEIYAASRCPSAAVVAIRQALSQRTGRELRLSERVGEDAFRQLARVTSGLDPAGPAGMLAQVDDALSRATEAGAAGRELTAAARRAFQVALRVQRETGLGEAGTSSGGAVVAVAEKVLGPLGGRRVAVVGGGEQARAAAQQARDRLATVAVFEEPAPALPATSGGRGAALDALADELVRADVVVVGAGVAPEALAPARVARLMRFRRRRLVLVDLAVPRAISPGAGAVEDVFLFDADDLRKVVRAAFADRAVAVAHAERIVEEEVARFARAEPARSAVEQLEAQGARRDGERAAG